MTVNSVDLSPLAAAQLKIILLGPPGALSRRVIDPVRSLQKCDDVSADDLIDREIAGNTPLGQAAARDRTAGRPVSDTTMLAILRRWFWSRPSDRGFVLAGFPRTVAQAVVFDQWLDERDESLTACLRLDESGTSTALHPVGEDGVTAYYAERGLLFHPGEAGWSTATADGALAFLRGLLADR